MRKLLLPMNLTKRPLLAVPMLAMFLILSQVDVLTAAVEWPWQQQAVAEQKAKSSNVTPAANSSAMLTPSTQSGALSAINNPAAVKAAPGGTPLGKSVQAAAEQNSFTVMAMQRKANYEEAVKMQTKLNDLLRISSDMDRLNRSKVSAVQSLVEKARTNEEILKKLSSPDDTTAKLKKVDAAQILLSKKLRGMREDAEKQIALAESNKTSAAPSARKTA